MAEKEQVTLCATRERALEAWEEDEGQTIMANREGTLWVVGYPPGVHIGHREWEQVSPEELEAQVNGA